MTIVGAGGVAIRNVRPLTSFSRQLVDLPREIREEVRLVLKQLKQDPRPKSLRFEKLNGHKNPDIYTIHATSNHNYKISFMIKGDCAILRNIGTHKEIDRAP